MSRWLVTLSGRSTTFEEYEVSTHETECDARAAAVALGGTLRAERMQGALYWTKDGRSFRVASCSFSSRYVLYGTREVAA